MATHDGVKSRAVQAHNWVAATAVDAQQSDSCRWGLPQARSCYRELMNRVPPVRTGPVAVPHDDEDVVARLCVGAGMVAGKGVAAGASVGGDCGAAAEAEVEVAVDAGTGRDERTALVGTRGHGRGNPGPDLRSDHAAAAPVALYVTARAAYQSLEQEVEGSEGSSLPPGHRAASGSLKFGEPEQQPAQDFALRIRPGRGQ